MCYLFKIFWVNIIILSAHLKKSCFLFAIDWCCAHIWLELPNSLKIINCFYIFRIYSTWLISYLNYCPWPAQSNFETPNKYISSANHHTSLTWTFYLFREGPLAWWPYRRCPSDGAHHLWVIFIILYICFMIRCLLGLVCKRLYINIWKFVRGDYLQYKMQRVRFVLGIFELILYSLSRYWYLHM